MSTTLKPIIQLFISGKPFHLINNIEEAATDAKILEAVYEETDGTGKLDKKRKGKRNTLKFTVINYDPSAPEQERFLTDTKLFKVGNKVRFRYGFEGDFPLSSWKNFKIVEVDESYPDHDIETVTVICHDDSKDMNLVDVNKKRPFKRSSSAKEDTQYSLEEVAKEICTEHNFQYVALDNTPQKFTQPGGWMQSKETDIEFLSRVSSDYGLDVYVKSNDPKTSSSKFKASLYFGARTKKYKEQFWGHVFRGPYEEYDSQVQQNNRVVYAYDFKAQVNSEEGGLTSETHDVDTKTKETYSATPELRRSVLPSGQGSQVFVQDPPKTVKQNDPNQIGRNKEDAKQRVTAQIQQESEAIIKAHLDCLMHPQFTAQTLIRITGRIAKKWKKSLWYVETMRITLSGGHDAKMFLNITKPPKLDDNSVLADTGKTNNQVPAGQLRRNVNAAAQGTGLFIAGGKKK